MAKTQKSTQKQSTQKRQQKQSQQSAKKLTAKLNELTTEQLTAVFTEAIETAEAELKAEETTEQKQTAETAQQTAEAEQTATETAEAEEQKRIEQTATDRDFAELKAVAQSFKIRDNGFILYIESQKQLETEAGEGTDNSVLIGRYGFGSNGKGELISVWCRRKATERKALMLTEWQNGKKKATEKHAFPCDFGLRFSQDDFAMFTAVAECKALIDSYSTEHAEVKHNEPRYSFKTLSAVTEALAKLYNAYESAQQTAEATKEATAEAETAKEA